MFHIPQCAITIAHWLYKFVRSHLVPRTRARHNQIYMNKNSGTGPEFL